MTAQIKQMPPVHIGYAQARVILRHHRLHDLDAIDAAFEVLAYSTDEADRALCRVVEDEMWLVPHPGAGVIVITMIAVALTCVGVATLVGRLVL
jgi:hypothetical protein